MQRLHSALYYPQCWLGHRHTIPVQVGETVGRGDVILSVMDFPFHMGKRNQLFFNLFSEYMWNDYTHGVRFEGEVNEDIVAFSPGFNCAINFNFAIIK